MTQLLYSTQHNMQYREPTKLGDAVLKRTYLREGEIWPDVAVRVAAGNTSLHPSGREDEGQLKRLIAIGAILMSGRHLSHGDANQRLKVGDLFTNCACALSTSILFYLLLNGCGVGTSYNDEYMLIDWAKHAPQVIPVIAADHKDYTNEFLTPEAAVDSFKNHEYHMVGDSREGWAKAVELWETMTYENQYRQGKYKVLILDFTEVRPYGSPIKGIYNKPSAGPAPLMRAFFRSNVVIQDNPTMQAWQSNMWLHHFFAESVLFGGVRRSSRLALKFWKDPDIMEFINIKQAGQLWTANNSVGVDQEFWDAVDAGEEIALAIFNAAANAAFFHGTGEPGLINVDLIVANNEGLEGLIKQERFIGSSKYQISDIMSDLQREFLRAVIDSKYPHGVNPCSEITLNHNMGYCVVGDLALANVKTLEQAKEAAKLLTRALIRTNLMDSLFRNEVRRTNRIGVSVTGVHEFAYLFFNLGFRDLLDESLSKDFWSFILELKQIVKHEAKVYSRLLGLPVPHTDTTVKPAGTTSKIFSLTEGIHLPAMAEYLRWVQYRADDPEVDALEKRGYPVRRDLKSYPNAAIVGFPTRPAICELGMGDKLVTAAEATLEEQFQWLLLFEKYWIKGLEETSKDTGNQISYTAKFKPHEMTYDEFCGVIKKYQRQVRCVSVMPQVDMTAYEYQPEEPLTTSDYYDMLLKIGISEMAEDVDREHIDCAGGACPIDFNK